MNVRDKIAAAKAIRPSRTRDALMIRESSKSYLCREYNISRSEVNRL